MSRWFRHYAGLMRDEKLVRVAVKAKQPVERVVWVWGAILESAAEINDAGRYEFDAGEAAYFLRCDVSDLVCIVECLENLGRISGALVVRWDERQFNSDSAKERQRRYRERRKTGSDVQELHDDVGQAPQSVTRDVTRPSRDGAVTVQEAETEADNYAASAREPSIDRRMAELYTALGVTDESRSPGLLTLSEPIRWVTSGCEIDADILPALRSIAARGKVPRSWAYCSDAVFEARDRRIAPAPIPASRSATAPPQKPLTQGESIRQMARERGILDASGKPTGRLAEGQRDREDPSSGNVVKLALPANLGW